ncbi:unnamed protein product [Lathyrus sativus]|nr:unnamed protein product [Lathyrus sativus]
MLNHRTRKNSISSVLVNSAYVEEVNSVKQAARDHFSKRFYVENTCRPELDFTGINRLSVEDVIVLEEKFCVEEIREVIFEEDENKSLGPDGFNVKFIKRCCDIVGKEVVDCINEFHDSTWLPKVISSSFLALIPKKENPQSFDDYRPITLIGCIYKIVSKVLAAKLKRAMGKLI